MPRPGAAPETIPTAGLLGPRPGPDVRGNGSLAADDDPLGVEAERRPGRMRGRHHVPAEDGLDSPPPSVGSASRSGRHRDAERPSLGDRVVVDRDRDGIGDRSGMPPRPARRRALPRPRAAARVPAARQEAPPASASTDRPLDRRPVVDDRRRRSLGEPLEDPGPTDLAAPARSRPARITSQGGTWSRVAHPRARRLDRDWTRPRTSETVRGRDGRPAEALRGEGRDPGAPRRAVGVEAVEDRRESPPRGRPARRCGDGAEVVLSNEPLHRREAGHDDRRASRWQAPPRTCSGSRARWFADIGGSGMIATSADGRPGEQLVGVAGRQRDVATGDSADHGPGRGLRRSPSEPQQDERGVGHLQDGLGGRFEPEIPGRAGPGTGRCGCVREAPLPPEQVAARDRRGGRLRDVRDDGVAGSCASRRPRRRASSSLTVTSRRPPGPAGLSTTRRAPNPGRARQRRVRLERRRRSRRR